MASPTRSETALIRPFDQLAEVDMSLNGVKLTVDHVAYDPGAVVLAEDVVTTGNFALSLPNPSDIRDAVNASPVPTQDCGLVVLATARSNRVSRVLLREYLKPDNWPESFTLNRAMSDVVLRDRAGFVLTVAVVLMHDLTPAPLQPNLAGTWLARREFSVSPERDDASFSPEELSEEIRVFHELPVGVTRYVHVGDWQDAEVLSDAVRVFVDPDILSLLLASPSDKASIQVQVELAIQAMETVASAIARELADDAKRAPSLEALAPFQAASRFFESLSRGTGVPVEDLLDSAVSDPSRLRSQLEAEFGLKSATIQALKES
jgi:hypothetical protein